MKNLKTIMARFVSYMKSRKSFNGTIDRNTIRIDFSNFSRIPKDQIGSFSEGIKRNAIYPAGEKVVFRTKACNLKIRVLYKKRVSLQSMSSFSASCIDLYTRFGDSEKYLTTIGPKTNIDMTATYDLQRDNEEETEYILYLCSYSSIELIEIDGSAPIEIIDSPSNLKNVLVVYGSSISQGCAAPRPGLSYANIIARESNHALKNYGFSESAKGEKEMAQLLAEEKANIYVLEYDHNATVQELRDTHYQLYKIIRSQNPSSCIILLSRFSGGLSISSEEAELRREIICRTYETAIAKGDENVFFIDGGVLSGPEMNSYFTDDRHPNEDGMQFISRLVLEKINEYSKKYV